MTNRIPAENVTANINGHTVDIALAYVDGRLHEIAFVGRGKPGEGLDHILSDLSIALSRAIQGRDPNTGE